MLFFVCMVTENGVTFTDEEALTLVFNSVSTSVKCISQFFGHEMFSLPPELFWVDHVLFTTVLCQLYTFALQSSDGLFKVF